MSSLSNEFSQMIPSLTPLNQSLNAMVTEVQLTLTILCLWYNSQNHVHGRHTRMLSSRI